MVRSRGSYCSTPRSDIVVIATSAGSTGPAMRRLVEFPAMEIVRPGDGGFAQRVGQFRGIGRAQARL